MWSEEFVFPPVSFLFGAVCHSEERQATFLSRYHPHHHLHRLLLMQSSEGWHSNYAFFKRNCKSSHRATSNWQPNWSSISLERLHLLPTLGIVGKGTSAGREPGRFVRQVHLSRDRTRRWGAEFEGQTHNWEQEHSVWLYYHPNPERMGSVHWRASKQLLSWL